MKKIVVGMLCLALLAAVVGGVVLFLGKSEIPLEKVLPSGALFYIKFSDVRANLKEITSTRFWQGLQAVDYDFLLDQGDGGRAAGRRALWTSLRERLNDPSTKIVLEKFFGREFVVAVYPPEVDAFDPAPLAAGRFDDLLTELLSGIFLVTRIPADVQAAEFISGFWAGGADVQMETSNYKNQTLHFVALPQAGLKLGFVRVKDILAVGIGEKAVYRVVDVYGASEEALVSDEQFLKARQHSLDSADMIGFVDVELALRTLRDSVEQMSAHIQEETAKEDMRKQWQKMWRQTSGFKTLAFSGRGEAVSKFKFDLSFDGAALDSDTAVFYRCPSAGNRTLRFIPKDILGYQWSNCLDLPHYWGVLKKEMDEAASQIQTAAERPALGGLQDIEQIMGLRIKDDILPAFGDEIGGYLQDIQSGALFPYPHLVFFIEIADRAKAETVLAKLKEPQAALFQSEDYKGSTINYAALPLGNDIQPAYCFLGDYLLIALNRQLVKTSIDTYHDPSLSLVHSADWGEVGLGTSQESRGVQFIRLGQLMQKLEGVIAWSKTWMASQEAKKDAFRSGSEKRLSDAEEELALKKSELAQMKSRAAQMEDEIWNLNSKAQDASSRKGEMDALLQNIKDKEGEIASGEEQRQALEKIVQGYGTLGSGPQRRAQLIDRVVVPLLRSLGFVHAFGSRAVLEGENFESSFFIKAQ